MALQGTLETFALPDVLRLLASTKKTGCYRLEGDRGSGRLFVRDGQIVAGDVAMSPAVSDPSEVAFELLRFTDGEFRFQADATPPHETTPQDVEAVLDAADRMLLEWRDIESIVPSLNTWVTLRPDLPGDHVTIPASKWQTIVAIGGGCTVGQLGEVLSLGELPVSRIVRDLFDLGVIELHEAVQPPTSKGYAAPEPAYETYTEPEYESTDYAGETYEEPSYTPGGYDQPSYEEPAYEEPSYDQQPAYEEPAYEQPAYEEPAYEQQPAYDQPSYEQQPAYDQQPAYNEGYDDQYADPRYATAAYDAAAAPMEAPQPGYGYNDHGADADVIEFSPYGDAQGGYDGGYEGYDQSSLVINDSRSESAYVDDRYAAAAPPTRTAAYETDPTDAAEIARQLANLSPRAAKAVAAAAKATTQAEREAALAQVDETEDSINRELLLKFLGSVNS